jgi:hypothetical protein
MANKSYLYDNPGEHVAITTIPKRAQTDATQEHVVFIVPPEAPEGVKITGVDIYPSASVTGTATNYCNLNLIDRGATGAGTTELANYDLTSGNNLSAYVKKALYEPATPSTFAVGKVITLQLELVSGGLATPNMTVQVRYRPA